MKRVVIKIGSSTLVKDGKVDAVFVGHLASECANLMYDEDIQPIIVSSGSIALGLEVLGIHGERPDDMPTFRRLLPSARSASSVSTPTPSPASA